MIMVSYIESGFFGGTTDRPTSDIHPQHIHTGTGKF